MIELRRRHVVDDRRRPRRQAEQAFRQPLAAHQRPGVVDQSGAQAGDQRAEPELNEDQRRERGGGSGETGACRRAARPAEADGGVDQRRIGRGGDQQMQRQPILRDLDAVGEAGAHHPPADDRLQRQETGGDENLSAERAFERAAAPEPQRRQNEGQADQAREQTMAPFPGVDRLEAVERHVGVERRVLRDLLVAVEGRLPAGFAERRNDAGHRLPFGDRQAGFGQPRRAADDDHDEDQRRHGEEPQPDGLRRAPGLRRGAFAGENETGLIQHSRSAPRLPRRGAKT